MTARKKMPRVSSSVPSDKRSNRNIFLGKVELGSESSPTRLAEPSAPEFAKQHSYVFARKLRREPMACIRRAAVEDLAHYDIPIIGSFPSERR
jgi:hypothetical protein